VEGCASFDIVFANHTMFSYTAEASSLSRVGLFQWNEGIRETEKICNIEIAPGIEKEFTLHFENEGKRKNAAGEDMDYGKIILQKSRKDDCHIADVTLSPASHDPEHVYPSLNGVYKIKEFVDPQKEFAITGLYMPKGRKWGRHFVFSVEKFEEGKETYIDWDQIFMTPEELRERKEGKQKNDQRNFLPEEKRCIASNLLVYGLSVKFVSEYTGFSIEEISSL
jgi:hypothetical protein